MKTTVHFKQLMLGLVIPTVVVVLWQVMGSMPDMAGILPTPLKVLEGWHSWIFAKPGMGLNPYLGTWLANVEYSPCESPKALPSLRLLVCRWAC
jgi:NitT/TauT family transport system permease protein